MTTLALIGLGSNLGDRKAHLDAAVTCLAGTPGVEVRSVSSYRETAPVGGPGGQGAFLNAAAVLRTTINPFELLGVLHEIEKQAGRTRTARWDARTLDLDLLIHGCKFLETPELTLPHPRLAVRRFVLAPLSEIAPTIVDPMTGRTIAQLLANVDRRPSYVALDGPADDLRTTVFERVVARLSAVGLRAREVALSPKPRTKTARWFVDDLPDIPDRLAADRWPADQCADRWIASDFCLGLDLLRPDEIRREIWTTRECTHNERHEATSARQRAITDAINGSLQPTFVVLMNPAPGGRLVRTPCLTTLPLLWIDSDDPDTIVAEVLAACAATRTG
jgi:2-amino-4-hydroxy-6-hydroxymethyldihydropteridine diphosphokinase